ncbi:hypothetical protein DPEC_G00348180 [Dallia pectoralis]|uniref:Uncharacterized protein n=1 Tax=Dallia pectoralis TaxID=75939 RepID=A0ACC2F4A1_DALPE|nr:hypothetical protein DPEC_G00348180 [Dallia pectoralis]
MPFHCSRCTFNLKENYRLQEKIAKLESRLQVHVSGKAYGRVDRQAIAPVPLGTQHRASPSAQPWQPGNSFKSFSATGKNYYRPAKISLSNRFSPLESEPLPEPCSDGNERLAISAGSPEKLKTLVIGDSITRSIRLEDQPAIIHCLPGGRATDVAANLELVLAKSKTGKRREYRDIVIHVGTNDVRMRQSEVTKQNLALACSLAKKMCRHRVIVSGPLPARGSDEIYSRLSQLNRWLKTEFCPSQSIGYVDNWPGFWVKPDLLKSDGLHPSWRGALLLSRNIARRLTPIVLT